MKARYVKLSLLLALGCGGTFSLNGGGRNVDVPVGNNSKNDSYRYQYQVNGCDTGDQNFSSKSDYCNGLKDEARNHGCAIEMRHKTYQQECQ